MNYYIFTSESVSEGHPDKIADQISDAILDNIIIKDKLAKVACETYIKSGMVIVGGEINTSAYIDIDYVIRNTIRNIGYIDLNLGFDANTCSILNIIGNQSEDIRLGLNKGKLIDQGAGDQGLMFGFATNETEVFMPAPIFYANRLMLRQSYLRKNDILKWLRPDAKSQVSLLYYNNKVIGVDTIVFSTQHSYDIKYKDIKESVMEDIIFKVFPKKWLNKNTKYYINPTGRFIIGGPLGDCGLTGRKIIVDTYGGMSRHGGGAFSGKDPSKVDRSGSYMARYIAKNIVASGLADKCEIQISYAIGISKPISIMVETFGTEKISIYKIKNLINYIFDLRPGSIIKKLDLLKPIYLNTASYGHFGREEFSWEKLNEINIINEFLNK